MSEEKIKKLGDGEWDLSELSPETIEIINHIYWMLSKKLELIPKGDSSFELAQEDFLNLHVPTITFGFAAAPLKKMQDEFHILKVREIFAMPELQEGQEEFMIEIPDRKKFKRFGEAIFPHTLQGVLTQGSSPLYQLSPEIEKQLEQSGVNTSLLRKRGRVLRDEDITMLAEAFAEGKVMKWHCPVCGAFMKNIDSVETLQQRLEEFKQGGSEKCGDRSHPNAFYIDRGQVVISNQPVPIKKLLKKSPAGGIDNGTAPDKLIHEDKNPEP